MLATQSKEWIVTCYRNKLGSILTNKTTIFGSIIRHFKSIPGEKCLITFDDTRIIEGVTVMPIDAFVLEDCHLDVEIAS